MTKWILLAAFLLGVLACEALGATTWPEAVTFPAAREARVWPAAQTWPVAVERPAAPDWAPAKESTTGSCAGGQCRPAAERATTQTRAIRGRVFRWLRR
jgi:hypothetical protein